MDLIKKYIEAVGIENLPIGVLNVLGKLAEKWSNKNDNFLKERKQILKDEIDARQAEIEVLNQKLLDNQV